MNSLLIVSLVLYNNSFCGRSAERCVQSNR